MEIATVVVPVIRRIPSKWMATLASLFTVVTAQLVTEVLWSRKNVHGYALFFYLGFTMQAVIIQQVITFLKITHNRYPIAQTEGALWGVS